MSNPKGLITPQEAKELNDAYTARCALISKNITKRDDNRSTWFSLEQIKEYIEYAEAQATELGYTLDGIRIYCGAYPEEDGQAGYTTSFLIPTGSRNEGEEGSGSRDIPEGNGLNFGQTGNPPGANYPQ